MTRGLEIVSRDERSVADSGPELAEEGLVEFAANRLRASVGDSPSLAYAAGCERWSLAYAAGWVRWSLAYAAGCVLLFCSTASGQQQAFFRSYCVKCHGAETAEGDVQFDRIDSLDAETWNKVYEQLASQEMPPSREKQPPQRQRAMVQKFALSKATESSRVMSTGLRRLNKREYTNTVRDLLGLKAGAFDPGESIYEDDIDEGFDTQAESLVISSELLLEYLGAAEKSLRQALFSIEQTRPKASVVNVAMRRMAGTGGNRYFNKGRQHVISRLGGGQVFANGHAITIPGRYRVTVTASGVDRDTYPIPLAPQTGPLIMGFGVGPTNGSSVAAASTLLKNVELKDNVNRTFHFEAWIAKGYRPYVSFVNGSGKPITQIRANIRRRKLPASAMKQGYKGPGIKVSQFKIEGPLHDEWPAQSIRTTLVAETVPDVSNATEREKLLVRFAARAFRRPVDTAEIKPYAKYLDEQFADCGDWRECLIRTFASMMASPDFLYIREEPARLDSTAVANRLSYFFWSTMPDDELFRLAAADAFRDSPSTSRKSELRTQVERL